MPGRDLAYSDIMGDTRGAARGAGPAKAVDWMEAIESMASEKLC